MTLEVIWSLIGYYDDESENKYVECISSFDGKEVDDILRDIAKEYANLEYDDSEAINFSAKSELIETIRNIKSITLSDNGKSTDVTEKYISSVDSYTEDFS